MKKVFAIIIIVSSCMDVAAQNVGIGTNTPQARLHVTDSSVVFSANGSVPAVPGNTPLSGFGRRMMWYPDKAAFRTGIVFGPNWDTDSTGKYSFAAGNNTKASGDASFAIGSNTSASGNVSFAAGFDTRATNLSSTALGGATLSSGFASLANGYVSTASGNYSFASGYFSVASGISSAAIGSNDTASGINTLALGFRSMASGDNAVAIGYETIAYNLNSFALGYRTRAKGRYSTASGEGTYANAWGSFSTGSYNDTTDTPDPFIKNDADRIFQVGNGNNNTNRSNALTMLRNGNTGLGVINPTERFEVNGKIKTTNLQVTNGAANGYILSSDVNGNANWLAPAPNYWSVNGDDIFNNNIRSVGIGTNSPQAKLHVADSNVVFTGPLSLPGSPVNPPISGAGTRMMWYPDKAAFRVGKTDGMKWDKDSIGQYSFAAGFNTKATSLYSTALGNQTTASNFYSTALGSDTRAAGLASTAMGLGSVASGGASTALGNATTASGTQSTSMGVLTVASGNYSSAMGFQTIASGEGATSMGRDNLASGSYSTTLGFSNQARGQFSLASGHSLISKAWNCFTIGHLNDTTDTPNPTFPFLPDRIFQVGNGDPGGARSNAITILRNGNTGVGITAPIARLHVADSNVLFTGPVTIPYTTTYYPPVSDAGSRMMWYPQRAAFRVGAVDGTQWNKDSIGRYSFSSGFNTKSIGEASASMGYSTTASGYASSSMGNGTIASGSYSTSMGFITSANGHYSTSMGANTIASGLVSTSMGNSTTANGSYSTSMGFITSANGHYSTSMGANTIASGSHSTSMGNGTTASGPNSTSMGFGTKAKSANSLVLGLFNDTTNTNRLFEIGNGTDNNARNNAMTVLANGNIGIGTTNPIRPLSFPPFLGEKILLYPGGTGEVGIGVYGNELRIHSDYAAAKISFGYQDNAGNFTQTMWLNNTTSVLTVGGTAYPSDERFKKQITAIQDPLQKLMNLHGVEYFMRKEEFPEMNFTNNRQTGLIAQEVEKVMPSAVYEINDKGYKGVDYAKLVPLLIEAIKELKKEVEALKDKK
jgi:Chaperone of endosialidase/Head domain of trimeric autotransporter adhesin